MNRFYALAAASLLAAAAGRAEAQAYPTDRGAFIVSGSAGASTQLASAEREGDRDESRYTTAHLAPGVQYFVVPGLAVGGAVQVTGSWGDDTSATYYGVGPQLSYYFGRGDRRFYPYLTAGASYNDSSGSDASVGQNAAAGVVFMLSRGVGMDTQLYYRRTRFGDDGLVLRGESVGLALGVSAFAF